MNLDLELDHKGTATLYMYLRVAMQTSNTEVEENIVTILERRGEQDVRATAQRKS